MSREVRIEFINDEGQWEPLVECGAEYLNLHKERIMAGKSRAGTSATFRAIAVDGGEVLEIWHSDAA